MRCIQWLRRAAVLLAVALGVFPVLAVQVTSDQARTAVGNWLSTGSAPLGAKFASLQIKSLQSQTDDDGNVLYHAAELAGGGFVITSADTELTPILAFSGSGSLGKLQGSPFESLLKTDQREKLAMVAKGAGSAAAAAATRRSVLSKGAAESEDAQAAWNRLLTGAASKGRLSDISDRRVDQLLSTEWDQSTWDGTSTRVFNYYTPNHYVCGCAATAEAQIMKYWNYPQGSVSVFECDCEVDGVAVTKSSLSGSFDWNNMPLSASLTPSPTTTQAEAIGKLTYNVGVGLSMSWSSRGSGALPNDIVYSLRNYFGYSSATYGSCVVGAGSVIGGDVENAIYASLDAHMPVALAIYGSPGGHAIVADGYGYSSGVRYTHLNMGWSGFDDMWYNLMGDAIYTEACGSFTYLKGICFNIHPTQTGIVVSGQVKSQSGSIASGASVKLLDSSGSVVSSTTADEHGIYSFRVTSTGTYRLRAESGTLSSLDGTVIVSSSTVNSWGNDLTLDAEEGLSDLCFQAPSTDWPAAVCLSASGSAALETSFTTEDTIQIFVGMGNAGTVTVPNVYKVTHEVLQGSTVVSSWVYESRSWDLMAPGDVTYWGGYAWSGLNGLQPGSYTYRCTLDSYGSVTETDESNNTATYSFTVTGGAAIPLATAVDNTSLSFTTGGSASWYGQDSVSYQGGSSARSGVIGSSQSSWMETTVDGPCTVSFWWKVSSESGWDKLKVYVDDVLSTQISGDVDWELETIEIESSGEHVIRWSYEKDGSVSNGSDCGWVDGIVVEEPSSDVTVTFDANGGTCATSQRVYTSGEAYVWFPRPIRSGYLFSGWKTSTGSSVNVASICSSGDHTLIAQWVQSSISLTEALLSDNSADMTFTTGGDAEWLPQARYTYDGEAAAYSGVIGNNQSSWVETVITGPGELSFKWLAGSEANYDWLKFYVDGAEISRVSDVHYWQDVVQDIGSGAHTIRWEYKKDGSRDEGWDCGYLDEVCWTPTPSALVTVTFHGCGGTVSESEYEYDPGTTDNPHAYGYLPSAQRADYRFDGWYTAETGGRVITEDQDVDTSVTDLYAHWTYQPSINLSAAVNAPNLTFTVGGDAPWFGQTADSQDGDGAAQSGIITHGQSSWMQTTVEVSGEEEYLGFWYKTSSESGWDKLKLYIDDILVDEFSGLTGWQYYRTPISGTGAHTVKWAYVKDGSVSMGEDCARVDAIVFPAEAPAQAGNDYAILAGINEYHSNYIPSYNWLSCCAVDVNNIKSVLLLDKCNWSEDNIDVMLNSAATKSALKLKMQEIANKVQSGDRVVYYQSSHGGQYSGTSTFLCAYDQDFSDTDFAEAISVFPSGVHLLIVIDACHSGGMFKSFGTDLAEADMSQFVEGVAQRLNEIRLEEHALGVKGQAKIGSGEIAWTTAADYNQYSWGGSSGSSFTITYCDAIRNGTADLTSGSIAVGNGDGKISALESAKYAYEYWKDRSIQGYSMTPQYHNESALSSFLWSGEEGQASDEKPNLRWVVPQDWPEALYLSNSEGSSAVASFDVNEDIYMYGAFQNNGEVAALPFTILHEVVDAAGEVVSSWTYDYTSAMSASDSAYSYWGGAWWTGVNGLTPGDYTYRCTLNSSAAFEETDDSDNVCTYSFAVVGDETVTISFDGNGGTPSESQRAYNMGGTYGSLPTAFRDGYAFTGWYTAAVGGSAVTTDSAVPNQATTLYAHWSATVFPDLQISWTYSGTSIELPAGSATPVPLYFTVSNAGGAAADATTVAIRLSKDGGGSSVLGYVSVGALSAGGSVNLSYEVAAQEFSGVTTAILTAEVDPRDVVEESDENNNFTSDYTVTVGESEDPSWLTEEESSDQQAMPTILQRALVKLPSGANAELGDSVGAFRSDTGALCGRGDVTVDGTATFFVRVSSGVTITFRVWDADARVEYATDSNSSFVVEAGEVIEDKVIQAVDGGNSADWQLNVVLQNSGWHLFSVNTLPVSDPSPANVFSASSGIDYVIGDQWWSPIFGGEMRAIEIGKGYWVHTTCDNVPVSVSGRGDPTKQMSLNAGWNLVGFNLRSATTASEALETAMARGNIRFVCTTDDTALFPYSPLTMQPGKGYWFYADQACTFAYDSVDQVNASYGAEESKDNLPQNPWTGRSIQTAQAMPTVIQEMVVTVDGQLGAKGDVVAVVDSDGALYSLGAVAESGKVTLVLSVKAGKTLSFRYWPASSGLISPQILSNAQYDFTTPDDGTILTGWTVAFGSTPSDLTLITLDYNGASGYATETISRTTGEAYGLLPTPTWRGHTFVGWFTANSGGIKITSTSIVPSSAVTLYARWTADKTYSVKVRGDAKSLARADSSTVLPGDVVTLSANSSIVKNGKTYIFQKWVPSSRTLDLGSSFHPGDSSTTFVMPKANVTLTASYISESKAATLTGVVNASTPSYGGQTFQPDTTQLQWSPDGRTWYADGESAIVQAGSVNVRWRSLLANWEPNESNTRVIAPAGQSSQVSCWYAFVPVADVSTAVYSSGNLSFSSRGGSAKTTPTDGRLLPDESVTFVATPEDGYVFVGWMLENDWVAYGNLSFIGLQSTMELDDLDSRYTDMSDMKIHYVAVFRNIYDFSYEEMEDVFQSVCDDCGNEVEVSDNQVELSAMVGAEVSYNVLAGCRADALPLTVKLDGKLPKGLKLDTKTGVIAGVPTEAGTSGFYIIVSNPLGYSDTLYVRMTVDSLRSDLVGEFRALLYESEWDSSSNSTVPGPITIGSLEMSVTSAGKVSAKVITESGTTSVTPTLNWSPFDDLSTCSFVYEKKTVKSGKTTVVSLSVYPYTGSVVYDSYEETKNDYSGVYGIGYGSWANRSSLRAFYNSYYTVALSAEEPSNVSYFRAPLELAAGGYVTLTVDDKGTVKYAGVLPDGEKLSGSTVLLADGDDSANVNIFTVPSGYKKNGLFAMSLALDAYDRARASEGCWLTPPLMSEPSDFGSCDDDGLLTKGYLNVVADGAVYSQLYDLYRYYLDMGVEAAATPWLEYSYTEDGVKTIKYAEAVSTFGYLGSFDLSTSSGSISVSKAGKPTLDSDGEYDYFSVDNPAGLTIDFKSATGIFSGKYSLYFDYYTPKGESETLNHKAVSVSYAGVVVNGDSGLYGLGSAQYSGKYTFGYYNKKDKYTTKTYTGKTALSVSLQFDAN